MGERGRASFQAVDEGPQPSSTDEVRMICYTLTRWVPRVSDTPRSSQTSICDSRLELIRRRLTSMSLVGIDIQARALRRDECWTRYFDKLINLQVGLPNSLLSG